MVLFLNLSLFSVRFITRHNYIEIVGMDNSNSWTTIATYRPS